MTKVTVDEPPTRKTIQLYNRAVSVTNNDLSADFMKVTKTLFARTYVLVINKLTSGCTFDSEIACRTWILRLYFCVREIGPVGSCYVFYYGLHHTPKKAYLHLTKTNVNAMDAIHTQNHKCQRLKCHLCSLVHSLIVSVKCDEQEIIPVGVRS